MKEKFSILSTVTFTVIGAYIEEFLSEFMKSGIKAYNIHNIKGIVYITIKRREYKKAAYIARSCRVRVRVYKRNGLNLNPFRKNKHAGIVTGVVLASVLILIAQKFVWKINVYGSDKLSETQILNAIARNGIVLGAYCANLDTDSAEYSAKLSLSDISWINIEVNGSRVDVYVNEGDVIEKPEISIKTPCNVIAAKDGVIVETEVYSGTLLYKKGSGVSKGSVIVSGVVNDGADNLLMTHANAKIIAEFTETVVFRQDFTTTEQQEGKIKETEKELMLFGFVIPLTEYVSSKENKICEETINNCYIGSFELPWKIKTNAYSQYDEIEVTRTIEDVNRILEQKLEIYCKNFFSDYEILDISKKTEYDETGITLTADIKLKGDIAVKQEIMRKTD